MTPSPQQLEHLSAMLRIKARVFGKWAECLSKDNRDHRRDGDIEFLKDQEKDLLRVADKLHDPRK